MDNIGKVIEGENALSPEAAARVIYKQLFESGPNRLNPQMKVVALGVLITGLTTWRAFILKAAEAKSGDWEKKYKDAKAELDDVKLKYAILCKESGK